jgi:hypothetical protein
MFAILVAITFFFYKTTNIILIFRVDSHTTVAKTPQRNIVQHERDARLGTGTRASNKNTRRRGNDDDEDDDDEYAEGQEMLQD